ncbi:MAG: ceramide glucosyltransferase [Alphaproteobacteria bacterium]|jgi:ceramide glucosyltransferase|nr:ceramide glucosyltransferase [Alphaproteobacteria bacterium]
MVIAIWPVTAFCLAAFSLHIVSVFVAITRCRRREAYSPPPHAPAVSLIRPVCGIDNYCEETLRSSFKLDYPRYELIFCVASANDPVALLVKRMIAAHPQVPAELLVGDERISQNPKLNNLSKGWRAARGEWVVIADSNVLMPRDYIQRLLASWRSGTGLVCSPPIGCLPSGFWAEVECAFLNTYQARWQYFADSIGVGFAQGKSMLWRRDDLERGGGLRALAMEVAEDAASTKVVRANGKRVRLVDGPFDQPLGYRTAMDVWRRQLRWARLRRAAFKYYYAPEILSGGLLPITASGIVAEVAGLSPLACVTVFAALWYGGEAILAYAAKWPLSIYSPVAWMLRDLLLPALWIAGWAGNDILWRGNQMDVADAVVPAQSGDSTF